MQVVEKGRRNEAGAPYKNDSHVDKGPGLRGNATRLSTPKLVLTMASGTRVHPHFQRSKKMDIELRGVMLFDCKAIDGKVFLDRILLPHAETDEDVARYWRHPGGNPALKHISGAVVEGNGRVSRKFLRGVTKANFGSGDMPEVEAATLTGLPDLTRVMANKRLRAGAFVEIIPRGDAKLVLGHGTNRRPFMFAGKDMYHFSATLRYGVRPTHNVPGLDQLGSGDRCAIYSYEEGEATIDRLNNVDWSKPCSEIPQDDDFYWLYGMFQNTDGSDVNVTGLPVPEIDCSRIFTNGHILKSGPFSDYVSVSTCFPAFFIT